VRKFIVLLLTIAVSAAVIPAQGMANHTLRHKVNALYTFVHSCVAWNVLPLARYGNPGANHGYVYEIDGDPGLTSAVDFPQRTADTQWIVVQVRQTPACIRAIAPARQSAFAQPTGRLPPLAQKAVRLG
jgi:hypothetical protein